MSPDSTNALWNAIRLRLLAVPELTAIVGNRVFDRPTQGVTFPYVQLGESQVLPFEAQCVVGVEVFLTIHAWARDGWAGDQVRDMCAAVYGALHAQSFSLGPVHRLQLIEHQSTRVLRDPDGITRHGIIDFRADTTIDA